jgi:SPP1 gp7 family putative phage head morphogenesis protein
MPILDKYGAATVLAILNNEVVELGPMGDAIRAAILADLTAVALASMGAFADEVGLGVDDAIAQTAASAWARAHAGELVQGITTTTQAAVGNAVAAFLETPGMDRGQLEGLLQGAFGRTRAETIAVTEVTRAASEGAAIYKEQLRAAGLAFERVWRTSNDDLTCPICTPLNGKAESVWGEQFPAGPPAHPRCRCSVTLRRAKNDGE